ncbi:MAG TPA: hypothetical protein VN253_15750 [Kofleriaceae bacterium]|nr:hypothetical protein [Kofleriaceae bacterium]
MIAKLSLFTLLVAGATACKTTQSEDILTRGMYAAVSASADGTGSTTVSATLYLGPPSDLIFVDLAGGDQLIAHHGNESKPMSEQIILNIVSHYATFAADGEGEGFEVELRREVDEGAPSTRVTLPAPFTLGTIPPTVSRGAAFGVTWTGSSTDRMRWSADGACIESASGAIDGGAGSVTMPAGTFRKVPGNNVADSCQVKVTITRERDGELDRAYGKGGTAAGVQTRSVTFTSMP